MSAPLRFLGLAIVAYVGLRTTASALALEPITTPQPAAPTAAPMAMLPPGVPADMGPPPAGYGQAYGYAPAHGYAPGYGPPGLPPQALVPQPFAVPYPVMTAMMPAGPRGMPFVQRAPYSYPGQSPAPPVPEADEAEAEAETASLGFGEGEAPSLDQWPAIGTTGPLSVGGLQQAPSWGKPGPAASFGPAGQSRWSVDSWALLRQPRSGLLPLDDPGRGLNPGLAPAGSLGGSQAGLRLTWRPLPRVGVHARASTALMPQGRGGQAMPGGEGSLGVSWQPLASLPARLLAERRQRLGSALGGGRSAFAFLAEGGISDRELVHGIRLDGYGQAGVVGVSSRGLFADGALAATYPFMPRFAVGAGMWGGAQPGLSRFDAGPRLSYQLSPRLRMDLDYRFRMTGNADPPSGPALTISGGF